MSIVGVNKKLRRLSSVGSHDLKKVAGISGGLFSLMASISLRNEDSMDLAPNRFFDRDFQELAMQSAASGIP
jgi:hypothetical protein